MARNKNVPVMDRCNKFERDAELHELDLEVDNMQLELKGADTLTSRRLRHRMSSLRLLKEEEAFRER